MRVGLFGFGKTGQSVATVLLDDPNIELVWIAKRTFALDESAETRTDNNWPLFIGLDNPDQRDFLTTYPVDAIVDFSSESGLDTYHKHAAKNHLTVVSAVSSYSTEKQAQLRTLARDARVLWSPNITLGINFLFLAARAIKAVNPNSDVQVSEEHFREKKETSGTALRLARMLEKEPESINVVRAGGIVGIHEVLFGYQHETLRLRHESISRQAFGDGALFALRQIHNRSFGLYKMEDLLLPYFENVSTTAIPVLSGHSFKNKLRTLITKSRTRKK